MSKTVLWVLSENPVKCAEYLSDQDLGAVAWDYVQVLSAAHMVRGGIQRSSGRLIRWAAADKPFGWVNRHIRACLDEQQYRFGVYDISAQRLLFSIVHEDDEGNHGIPRFLSPAKCSNPVGFYRSEYLKQGSMSWTKREVPGWWGSAVYQNSFTF